MGKAMLLIVAGMLGAAEYGVLPAQGADLAQRTNDPGPEAAGGFTIIRNLRYGDPANGVRNLLDLYLPAGVTGKVPVVIGIHGGGLTTGSKEMFGPKAIPLAKHGYAVAAVNYRLKPDYALPAQIYDCKAAVRWLRAHAGEYHLDPNRAGVVGGSAGATLAALLGTSGNLKELEGGVGGDPNYPTKVQAVVALAGVYREFPWFLVPRPPGAAPSALVRLCAPISHVSRDDPPFLLLIGDQDITPGGIADHRRFHEALREQGVESTLIIVPGAQHGQCFDRETEKILSFLDRHLRAKEPAPARDAPGGAKP